MHDRELREAALGYALIQLEGDAAYGVESPLRLVGGKVRRTVLGAFEVPGDAWGCI